jgi:hypothetical protein
MLYPSRDIDVAPLQQKIDGHPALLQGREDRPSDSAEFCEVHTSQALDEGSAINAFVGARLVPIIPVVFRCLRRSPNYCVRRAGLVMSSHKPIRITFVRSRVTPRAFLIDANLDLHSLEELRSWPRRKKAFVIVDGSTGEDIT